MISSNLPIILITKVHSTSSICVIDTTTIKNKKQTHILSSETTFPSTIANINIVIQSKKSYKLNESEFNPIIPTKSDDPLNNSISLHATENASKFLPLLTIQDSSTNQTPNYDHELFFLNIPMIPKNYLA